MNNVDISIIVPMRNLENKISSILMAISADCCNFNAEFIIVDMGSSDSCVLECLSIIKDLDLNGTVIQNGSCNLAEALNTGIYKSCGKYVTFLFPDRINYNYIYEYIKNDEFPDYDFIFSYMFDGEKKTPHNLINSSSGKGILESYLKSNIKIDIAAVLVNRNFIIKSRIKFYEDLNCDDLESFIINILLKTNNIKVSDYRLKRYQKYEVAKYIDLKVSSCLDEIESILRSRETALYLYDKNDYLNELFTYQKVPMIVMKCIDELLKGNLSYRGVKKILKLKKYDRLLVFNKITDKKLKGSIKRWKYTPLYYLRKK